MMEYKVRNRSLSADILLVFWLWLPKQDPITLCYFILSSRANEPMSVHSYLSVQGEGRANAAVLHHGCCTKLHVYNLISHELSKALYIHVGCLSMPGRISLFYFLH